ncbi:MAG: glycosyltransferase family 39 protein [Methanobrevibacter sp.]|nr:glycosyltransferase family 39 protein [Candidatus Methanovirga meridionalis]
MSKLTNFKSYKFAGICLSILSIILFMIMVILGLNQSLWLDETWTFILIRESFYHIIISSSADVHPPLYFALLKIFLEFFSLLVPSNISHIILAKIFSIIPLFFIVIFSLKKIKEDFGWLVSGVFTFCIITMPNLMYYGFQVRMYSWALFFVTLSFYYCYKITIKSNKKNWIIFTICALMGAYIHYYATIAITFIFLILLAHIILKNRKILKNWILSSVTMILLYSPCIILFFQQSKYFTVYQWDTVSLQSIIETIGFIFSPMDLIDYTSHLKVLGAMLLLSLIILSSLHLFELKKLENYNMIIELGGIFVLITTMFFSFLFSILVKPMFIGRYAVPMLGCFWLSFSVSLSNFRSKKIIFIPILIILLLNGMINTITFIDSSNYLKLADLGFNENINQISENDTIIYLGYPWMIDSFFKFYLKENEFIAWNDNSTVLDIEKLKNNKIWVFDSGYDLYGGIFAFNKTLTENGFKLDKISVINKRYLSYPTHIYLIS